MNTKPDETFTCIDCGTVKPVKHNGGTGYADRTKADEFGPAGKVCYACCAICDRAYMEKHGRIVLYLTYPNGHRTVSNWPGTLKFQPTEYRVGDHNIAGRGGRIDVWFNTGLTIWHGVNIGDNDILRCRRTKRPVR